VFMLSYYFIISVHHDWINPALIEFDQRRAVQVRREEAQRQQEAE
jgi:hypothetical protein